MHRSEEFARACFETVASPRCLRPVPDQSHGEHDFDVLSPSGTCVGALEVTSAVDEDHVSTTTAIFHEKHGGQNVKRVLCKSDWHVTVLPGTSIRRLRVSLDTHLAAIEADGMSEFHARSGAPHLPSVDAICRGLGVASGQVIRTSRPGVHWIGAPVSAALSNPSAVNDVICHAAERPDNLRKLSKVEHGERHLFVFIDSSIPSAYIPLVDGDLAVPVTVDRAITHVWAGAHTGTAGRGVVWCAKNGEPWLCSSVDLGAAGYSERPVTQPALHLTRGLRR